MPGIKEEKHVKEKYKVKEVVSLDEEGIRVVGMRINEKNSEIRSAKRKYDRRRDEATKAYKEKLGEISQDEEQETGRINTQHASKLISMLESYPPQH